MSEGEEHLAAATAWHPDLPPEHALPKEAQRRLNELAKADTARVVWRHQRCGRIVAVVQDLPERWLFTYDYPPRLMLGVDREGLFLGPKEGPFTIIGQVAPADVWVRCCGTPWELPWRDLWAEAESAPAGGVSRRET